MNERKLYITWFLIGDDADPGVDIYYIPSDSGPFRIQMEMKSPEGLKTLEMLETGEGITYNGFTRDEAATLLDIGVLSASGMHDQYKGEMVNPNA